MSAGHNKAWVHVRACGPSEMAGKEKHSQSTSLQSRLSLLLPVRMRCDAVTSCLTAKGFTSHPFNTGHQRAATL